MGGWGPAQWEPSVSESYSNLNDLHTINGRDFQAYYELNHSDLSTGLSSLPVQSFKALRNMTSLLSKASGVRDLPLLSAITLGALALCAPAAPLDRPPGGAPSDALEAEALLCESPLWALMIAVTARHKEQFEEEFSNETNYDFLERTEIPSPPGGCPAGLTKEACLLRLVQGLQVYTVLLQHVKREYPDNPFLPNITYNTGLLIQLLKGKMRHPERVVALSALEAELVLRRLEGVDTFLSRLNAHSILRKLHHFLVDSKRGLARKEALRSPHKRP
ncbi:hypothetical protein NHX12_024059 [Muraenolepis orangiensis]|uniref:Interleukin-6 n=1 Tax=Muraenolepis orangiensis TaxID=630683 RepID=A0A9Q0EM04_9TELE|nr:hypothetical protein NHX12_024059 [Muraenolepis orangiensis]